MDSLLNADGTPAGLPAGGAAADLIKDSDTQNFAVDVLDASMEVPVLVDFWATWCGPCKTLGPTLEKVVRHMGGAVRLVKVDVDKNQDLAMQLRIQSVPTVYAFKNGQPVDAFQGALPESQIRAFIDRLTGGAQAPAEMMLAQAQAALDAGDARTAGALFSQLVQADPNDPAAVAGLARTLVAEGRGEEAERMLDSLPDKLKLHSDVAAARSALDLAKTGGGDAANLEAALAADPDDHQARLDLANALFAGGKAQEAVDHLLDLVRRDRAWNDEAGRKQLVKVFEALGHTHPVTVAARKRLSSLLFS